MLRVAGFGILERGTVNVVNEWPDTSTAVRALAAAGPSVPAIEAVGYEVFCEALREVISPICDRDVGVRITSEFDWITAVPGCGSISDSLNRSNTEAGTPMG
jgi:hypothetical protein